MYKERIWKGVALLTLEQLNEIDLERLNMKSGSDCVLGQIYGEYIRGRACLGLNYEESIMCGFNIDAKVEIDVSEALQSLTEEWKQVLTEHRAGQQQRIANQRSAEFWT